MPSPFKLTQIYQGLTAKNQLLKRKLKLGTDDIPIPPKRDDVTAIEAINKFNERNPRINANDIQPVVKQSTMKQSNVGEPDEGVIQGAFDTATMEARDGGYPPPIYEAFKKRYLKRNMKADGGRAGYEDGGMLVQPSDDGSRPGYKESKYKQITELSDFKKMQMGNKKMKDFKYEVQLPNKDGTLYTDYFKTKKDAKEAIKNSIILEKDFREGLAKRDKKDLPPSQKKLDKYRTITPTEEYAGYGKNKARIFKVENPNSGSVRYTIEGVGGKKQPLFKTLEEAREAKIADTPDEFVRTKKTPFRPANNVVAKEYINYKTGETKIKYKPTITLKGGKKATGGDSQGFNSLQEAENWVSDYREKNPLKIREADPNNRPFAKNKRRVFQKLEEGRQLFAKTPEGYVLHHMMPIGDRVPFKTDEYAVITKKINADLSKYDTKILKLVDEAYSLDFNDVKADSLKLENINKKLAAVLDEIKTDLPKEYQGLVGFNKLTPVMDENGIVIDYSSKPVGLDYKKSITGKKTSIPVKTVETKEFKNLVKNAPKTEQVILQNIQSYSKLPECRIDKVDGGRIGFAYSDKCLRDGLKEQKIEAQKGNKKAAQELVETAKVATRAGLLKNLLGPGAILGEAVYEGAMIGNKVLGGKELNQAWAESYLSGLDPLEVKRKNMITRKDFSDPDYAEDPYTLEMVKQGESKTIDGPNANILRSGFAAQDQVSAFNEAVNEKFKGERANRFDIANRAAADVREQGRFVDQSKDIISSDAFQEATKQAQEYIANQEAQNRFNLGIFGTPQGELSDDRRRFKANKEMQALGGTYQDYENPFTKDEYENFARQEGYLASDKAYTDKFFTNSILNPLKFEQLMETPGFKGASNNFASGGIASLTKTIPPESGPTPHGLPYVYNNVKKI